MPEVETWLQELISLNDEDTKMTDKQIRIVQAAVDIFAEKGFASASTNEIAQRAGVAEGTIFRHYKTKKELLLSIVAPMMTKLIAPFAVKDFAKILDAEFKEFEDFLRVIIRNRMEFARKNLPILKIFLHEVPFHPELKAQFKEIVGDQILNKVTKVITRFQREGKIIDIPSPTAIRLMLSSVIGLVLTRFLIMQETDWDEEQEIECTIQFMMHGLAPRK